MSRGTRSWRGTSASTRSSSRGAWRSCAMEHDRVRSAFLALTIACLPTLARADDGEDGRHSFSALASVGGAYAWGKVSERAEETTSESAYVSRYQTRRTGEGPSLEISLQNR